MRLKIEGESLGVLPGQIGWEELSGVLFQEKGRNGERE